TLLGGEVTVHSEADRGTLVRVTLPIPPADAATADAAPPVTTRAPATESDGRPAGTVLYIEDNPVNATLVEGLLSPWPKVRLVIAPDGTSGMAQAVALQPDLVLLDMQLPDTDGLQVLAALQADDRTRT